jgi:hypothetical protein
MALDALARNSLMDDNLYPGKSSDRD